MGEPPRMLLRCCDLFGLSLSWDNEKNQRTVSADAPTQGTQREYT